MQISANTWNKGIATAAFVIVVGIYGNICFLVPGLEEVFSDFGTELPLSTQIVIETHLYWSLFVALGVVGVVQIFWRNDSRGWYFLIAALISAFILQAVTVWAMYAPVLAYADAT